MGRRPETKNNYMLKFASVFMEGVVVFAQMFKTRWLFDRIFSKGISDVASNLRHNMRRSLRRVLVCRGENVLARQSLEDSCCNLEKLFFLLKTSHLFKKHLEGVWTLFVVVSCL